MSSNPGISPGSSNSSKFFKNSILFLLLSSLEILVVSLVETKVSVPKSGSFSAPKADSKASKSKLSSSKLFFGDEELKLNCGCGDGEYLVNDADSG